MATTDFTIAPIDIEARRKLDVRAGDTVRVWQRITERFMEKDKVKEKVRSQAFEGLVLARKHGKEAGATFTVRKVIDGIGVEKIFGMRGRFLTPRHRGRPPRERRLAAATGRRRREEPDAFRQASAPRSWL